MTILRGTGERPRTVLGYLVALVLGSTLLAAPLVPDSDASPREPVGLEAPAPLVLSHLNRLSSASFASPFRWLAGPSPLALGPTAVAAVGHGNLPLAGHRDDRFKRWVRWLQLRLEGG